MERLEVEFVGSVSGLEKSLNQVQSKLQEFGKTAQDLGSSLSKALSLPILGLGVAAVKSFGDIQSLKNGLAAVTGSADAAAVQFVRLQKLAQLPGLGLPEVAKGSINLQAIGFSAEKAEAAMGAFGNAVATVGKGRDEFQRAIYGLQQLANTDFPLGEDLNIIKDAIPQVTPLLKEAFGSARTDDLQKLGITSKQVVDTIITGLSKLPAVTGGINGAFENLSDGVTSNLSNIGESINTAFDIGAIINSLIARLTAVTQAFTNLSPATQKVILIIAGVAAAVGPLLVVLGLLSTTVIPAVISGITLLGSAFAILTGPIGLIAIAIGAAVFLIIDNWDKIVQYFTTGDGVGVFDALTDVFNSTISFVTAAWKSFTSFLIAFWDTWGGSIVKVASIALDSTVKVFQVAFALISNVFKVGTAVLTGNWAAIGPILLNTTKKIWNAVLGIITNVIQLGSGLVSKFFEFIGLGAFGDKIDAMVAGIKNKLSFDIPVSVNVDDTAQKITVAAADAVKPEIEKKVQQLSASAKEVAKIYNTLATEVQKNANQFGATHLDVASDDVKSYQKAIDALIEQGYKPESKAITDLIAKQKELDAARAIGALTVQTAKVNPETVGFQTPDLQLDPDKFDVVTPITNKLATDFEALSQTILQNGVSDAFASLGTSIGGALSSGGSLLSALGSGILGIVGGIATQLGKAAIGIGVAMIGIKKAFSNPFTAIAAGIALVALGSFISSKVSNMTQGPQTSDVGGNGGNPRLRQFANGGIISGPTVGLMGEYAGARNNPEVVAPLNKLKGLLPAGGDSIITTETKLRGEDIYILMKRTAKRMGGVA